MEWFGSTVIRQVIEQVLTRFAMREVSVTGGEIQIRESRKIRANVVYQQPGATPLAVFSFLGEMADRQQRKRELQRDCIYWTAGFLL